MEDGQMFGGKVALVDLVADRIRVYVDNDGNILKKVPQPQGTENEKKVRMKVPDKEGGESESEDVDLSKLSLHEGFLRKSSQEGVILGAKMTERYFILT
eukprot:UN24956